MKKTFIAAVAAAMVAVLCACQAKQADVKKVNFTELQLGTEKTAVAEQLGTEGVSSGSSPERIDYKGVYLFEFVDQGENTKLTVFLNTENQAYAFAYYMYDALEQNYKDVKEYFEKQYGPASAGENASEIWTYGDRTYSLFKQSDYIAVSIF